MLLVELGWRLLVPVAKPAKHVDELGEDVVGIRRPGELDGHHFVADGRTEAEEMRDGLLPKTQVDCGGQFDFCAGSCKKH